MNKYLILLIIGAAIIGGGIAYRAFFVAEADKPYLSGKEVRITVVAEKNEWRFTPETIEVERGDRVIMTLVNEDDYDHGIAIDQLGVSQRMPALSTIETQFVVTQEGDFPFYCSVPCGEGDVVENGQVVHRDHFDMVGVIRVTPAARQGE